MAYRSGVFLSALFSKYAENIFFTSSKSFAFKDIINSKYRCCQINPSKNNSCSGLPAIESGCSVSLAMDGSRVKPRNLYYAFNFFEFADQQVKVTGIIDVQHDLTFKYPLIGTEGYRTHVDL